MLPFINQGDLLLNTIDFMPELVICLGVVGLLVLRLFRDLDRWHLGGFALLVTLVALLLSVLQWLGRPGLISLIDSLGLADTRLAPTLRRAALKPPSLRDPQLLFGGLLIYDYFTVYLRVFLYLFTFLVIWLTRLTGIPDREDSADFYCLLL